MSAQDVPATPEHGPYGEALFRLARRARRLFRLTAPDSPGLYFVGAQFDPASLGLAGGPAISASGKGMDAAQSVQSCLCEAAEILSQMVWGGEALESGRAQDLAAGLSPAEVADLLALLSLAPAADSPIRWLRAARLAGGSPVLVPAALALRNLEPTEVAQPQFKLSSGCGAGPVAEKALLHGLLELVERDAIALWWLGGRPARRLAPEAAAQGAALVATLRGGITARDCWLLDISTDLGIPCVAALSTDETGFGLACGFSAHYTYEGAVRGAILEMCQMELGLRVIELKVQQDGESALGESDQKHRRRARTLDARACAALHPADAAADAAEARDPGADALAWVAARLAAKAIEAFVVDLSRPQLGIPTLQAVAPRLQPMPSKLVSRRLEREIAGSGGGFGLTNAIELM